jgi:hypothetical protein
LRNLHLNATEVTVVSGAACERISFARSNRKWLTNAMGEQPWLLRKVAKRLRALLSVAATSASIVMGRSQFASM